MRAKLIYEKFKEHSDPIKDMDIGALKVFAIRVNLENEEWQMSRGVDIVVAKSKKQAREIWNMTPKTAHYWTTSGPKIEEIKEIDITQKGFYHIEDAAVE